jgi:hypothetical protein
MLITMVNIQNIITAAKLIKKKIPTFQRRQLAESKVIIVKVIWGILGF